ncbi:hypothetical protein ACYX7E_04625 [Luteimonas sp. RIT-PG2_3]
MAVLRQRTRPGATDRERQVVISKWKKTPIYQRVPRPWAGLAYLLVLGLVFALFLGRSMDLFKLSLILDHAPTFYTHVSNFSISYLLYTAIGYQWLMTGVKRKPVVLLGLAIALCNVVYEGFIPFINTPDSTDAGYGLAGTLLGWIVLWGIDRYGLVPNPAHSASSPVAGA